MQETQEPEVDQEYLEQMQLQMQRMQAYIAQMQGNPSNPAASEAAAGGLHQEGIQPLAGVTTAEWQSWYNRRYLGERLRVSRALGL